MVEQKGPWQQRSATTYRVLQPSFFTAFLVYYLAVFGYGLTATLLGVFTIRSVTSDAFAEVWSMGVAGAGATAAVGLIIGARLHAPWVEVIGTCVLLGLLAGYILAVLLNQQPERMAGAWLPLLVGMFPTWRVVWISNDGGLSLRRRERE